MLGKNKNSESKRKLHYKIRKLTIGVVSFLCGFSMIFGTTSVVGVSAEENRAATPTSGTYHKHKASEYNTDIFGLYSYSRLNSYDSRSYKGDQEEAERRVKVEAISDENDNYEQKWRITFNDKGFWTQPGRNPYKNNDYNNGGYKANPYLGFALSDDLRIVGNTKIEVQYRSINTGNVVARGEYNGPLKTTSDYLTPRLQNSDIYGDQGRIQGTKHLKRDRNLITNKDNLPSLQESLNDKSASNGYFRMSYIDNPDGQGDVFNKSAKDKVLKDAGEIFSMYYYSGKSANYAAKNAAIVVEFTTKRDPHKYFDGGHRTFVMGEYNSWDWNSTDLRGVVKYVDVDGNTDSDQDGLSDLFERHIGSDPNDPDTDKDGRKDGRGDGPDKEVVHAFYQNINGEGLYKIPGTDPTHEPPSIPDTDFVGLPGEVITGKAKPHSVVALYQYTPQGSITGLSLGEAIADKDGNYKIVVGKVFDRTQKNNAPGHEFDHLNEYNNNIKLEHKATDLKNDSFIPRMVDRQIIRSSRPIVGSPNGNTVIVQPGNSIRMNEWSDGFDGRPLFSVPELSEKKNLVDLDKKINDYALNPKEPVKDKTNLTQEEKNNIVNKIKNDDKINGIIKGNTPDDKAKNIVVKNNGDVEVTLIDGSKKTIPAANVVEAPKGVKVANAPTLENNAGKINSNAPTSGKIIVKDVDPNADKIELYKGDEKTPFVTLTKESNGTWTSSDATKYPVSVDNGNVIVTPNDDGKNELDNKNVKATAKNSKYSEKEGEATKTDEGKSSDPALYDAKAPHITNTDTNLSFNQNQAGEHTITTDDATATVTVKDGESLPAGVSLVKEGSTYKVKGTPTSGENKTVHLVITDNNGNSTEKEFTVSVTAQEASAVPELPNIIHEQTKEFNVTIPGDKEGQLEVTAKNGQKLNVKKEGDHYKVTVPAGVTLAKDDVVTAKFTESGKAPSTSTKKVVDSYAKQKTPVTKEITVNKGDTPKAEDIITNKDALPQGTKYTFVNDAGVTTPVDTATPGDKPVKVKVTYPDGSSEVVDSKVHVNNEKSKTPTGLKQNGNTLNAEVKGPVDAKTTVELVNEDGSSIKGKNDKPITGTIDPITGKITIPLDQLPNGTNKVKVKVTEPNKAPTVSTETSTIDTQKPGKPTVTAPDADKKNDIEISNIPEDAKKVELKVGDKTITLTKGDDNHWTSSDNENFPVRDGDAGKLIVTPKDKTSIDGKTITAQTTDKAGNVGEKSDGVVAHTVKKQSPKPTIVNEPAIHDQTKEFYVTVPNDADKEHGTLVVKKGDTDLTVTKEGDRYKVTVPANVTLNPNDQLVATFTEPGKTGTNSDPVTVKKSNATDKTPTPQQITVDKNVTPNAGDGIANKAEMPDGTTYKFVNEQGGDANVDTTTPGDKQAKVKVTYPDGSSETVDVPVHVNSDADKSNATGKEVVVKKGATVNPSDFVENYEGVANKKSVAFKGDAPSTADVVNQKDVVVTITFNDGSTKDVTGKLTVQEQDASKVATGLTQNGNTLEANIEKPVATGTTIELVNEDGSPITGKNGQPITGTVDPATGKVTVPLDQLPDSVTNVKIKVTEPNKKPSLSGKVEIDRTAPGKPTVTAPDANPNNNDIVIGNIPEDAKKVELKVGDKTITLTKDEKGNWTSSDKENFPVRPGESGKLIVTPKDKAGINGKTITAQTTDKAGNVGDESDPVTANTVQQASKKPVVQPEIHDQTKEFTVTVPEDADKEHGTMVVKKGDTNLTVKKQEDGSYKVTLPSGVTLNEGDVITATFTEPGKASTNSDPVTVKKSNATDNTPETQPINVVKGGTPNAKDAISNKDSLPEKTTYTFVDEEGNETPVDTSEVGTKTVKVKVTYPDGSSEVVEVTVNVTEAPSTELTLVDPANKVKVNDPTNLSEEEKAKVKEEVKKANPSLKDNEITVNKDGSVTVTSGGKTGTIPAEKTVEAKKDNEKYKLSKPSEKVEVKDKNNLTEAEKEAVKEAVLKANPGLPSTATVTVGANGDVTVTFADGTSTTLTELVREKEATEAEKDTVNDPEKVKVDDPSNLTDAEREAVKEAVLKANPDLADKTVEVDKNGNVTITYKDGSKNTIPADKTVEEKTEAEKYNGSGEVTVPKNGTVNKDEIVFTPGLPEGAEVVELPEVDTTTEGSKEIEVPVKFADGSRKNVAVTVTVEENQASKIKVNDPANKVKVDNPEMLTDAEKEAVKEEVLKANPELPEGTEIEVDDEGNVMITYPDGSMSYIDKTKTVEAKTDAERYPVKNPSEKVRVEDPNNLSEEEKAKVKENVKKANSELPEGVEIEVDNQGNVEITYLDGSKARISSEYTVYVEEKAEGRKMPTTGVEGTVLPLLGIAMSGIAVGRLRKKEEDEE